MKHIDNSLASKINKTVNVFFRVVVSLAMLGLTLPMSASADRDDRGRARLKAQLTEFNGGCPPNECVDVQFSVHRAPVCDNGPNATNGNFSTSMVREFAPPGESSPLTGGSSTLVRAGDGVAFNLSTTDLAPNAPYTVWFVGFNPGNPCINPEGDGVCTCGEPDIDAVFYATGGMSDALGSATFVGNTDYGVLPGGRDQIPFADFAAPLEEGAEIHFVVRGHGRALKGNGGRGSDNDED